MGHMRPSRFIINHVFEGEEAGRHHNQVAFMVSKAEELRDRGAGLNRLFNQVLSYTQLHKPEMLLDQRGDYQLGFVLGGFHVFLNNHYEEGEDYLQIMELVLPEDTYPKVAQIERVVDGTGVCVHDLAIGVQHLFQAKYGRISVEDVMARLDQGLG